MRVGIDEAGKGPVLGPMVAAAVGVPEPGVLPEDVADSKELAPERRESLAERLRADERVAIGVAAISVERIDADDTDMNGLTVAAQAEALDAVRGVERGDGSDGGDAAAAGDRFDADGCTVLADAGDTSEERFARRLRDVCAGDPTVEARHGADAEDATVAAASIVAKVERDARVESIAAEYGEVGSGYPSDPTTREFLRGYVDRHGELPGCARESWQTCTDVLAAAAQSGLDEF